MNRTETIRLRSVFDHHADQSIVDQLRATIVEDIHSLLGNYENFGSVTVADLDKDLFASMRKKYDGLLHYGVFSLPPTRPFINELIWKWTEATGKYVGCQYWSVGAKALFDREAVSAGGWPITVRQARKIERELSKKRDRTNAVRLTHEHVYPIKDIKLSLKDRRECSQKEISDLLEVKCLGCVVLELEHDRTAGRDPNPWSRYREAGKIRISDNPAWHDVQRDMIMQAGLL